MADQYTPEEIQDIFDRYNDSIRRNIPVSEALAKEMADATKGVKNYTNQLNHSLGQLGSSVKTLSTDIAGGSKGASVFNNTINSTTDVVSKVASQFGVLGAVIGGVAKAFGFLFGAVNKQSDALFKTFQDISRSGAIGEQGMTDVFQSMKRFGYTIDELDKMTSVLADSSADFAQFSSTATTGSKSLSYLVEGFRDSRVQLQALGLSTDDQVRAAAGYYRQMGRLGRATDATSAGALAYIKEMEILTRLTGLQRKDLEKSRERAESIDAFQAALVEAGPEAAANMQAIFNRFEAIDPDLAQGYAESVNGIITGSEAQMKFLRSTNFEGLEIAQRSTYDLAMNADKAGDAIATLYKGNLDLQRQFAKIGITDYFGKGKAMTLIANKEFTNATQQATGEVDGLAAGTDKATKAQAELIIKQTDISNNLQDFVNLGVAPATQALANLAKVVENLTDLLPGSRKGQPPSLAPAIGGAAGAITSAKFGAGVGSAILPGIGTAIGALGGGLLGWFGGKYIGNKAAEASAGPPGGTDKLGSKAANSGSAQLGNLRIKSPESTAGGPHDERLTQAAMLIQEKLGSELIHFSAFNDSYHQGTNSAHAKGKALDFTIRDPRQSAQIAASIRAIPGIKTVLDEYTNPSSRSTAGHIHAEISGAAGFRGTLSGPMSGYRPNITMHGTEELSIKPAGSSSTNPNSSASEGTMTKLVERMDDLIAISKNQLGVNEKMLKYAQ
jgi:hypothetical protein